MSRLEPVKQQEGTDLRSGEHGVFVNHWRSAQEPPEETGNYLIAIHYYEPIIALFIKGRGWYLDETYHIGLEDSIRFWMPIPEPPRR